MIRLGFLFLGIGTSLFLYGDVCHAIHQTFPGLGEWIFAQLITFLLFLAAQPLNDAFSKSLPCVHHCLQVMSLALGLVLIGLGLVGGFLYSFVQNQKAKR